MIYLPYLYELCIPPAPRVLSPRNIVICSCSELVGGSANETTTEMIQNCYDTDERYSSGLWSGRHEDEEVSCILQCMANQYDVPPVRGKGSSTICDMVHKSITLNRNGELEAHFFAQSHLVRPHSFLHLHLLCIDNIEQLQHL